MIRTWLCERRPWVAVGVVAVLVVAACGSTAESDVAGRTLDRADAEAGDLGLGEARGGPTADTESTEISAPGAGPTATGGSGSGTGGVSGPSEAEGGVDSAPSQDGGERGPLPVAPGVHGVTDSTIEVGMLVLDLATAGRVIDAAGGGGSFGEGAASIDAEKALQAVVDNVNATGGVGGRKIKPVFHRGNVERWLNKSTRNQEAQEACSTWTEDNQVFAINGAGMGQELMLECAANSKTPMTAQTGNNAYPSQSRVESMADYWFGPDAFVADRRERAVARFLLNHGFFDTDAKVGLMIENQPGIREGVEKALKPTLAAAGITPAVEVVYPDPIESPWANYVLQMQVADVTHIVFSAMAFQPSWPTWHMMQAAEDQQYRPMWGAGTDSTRALTTQGAPRAQLANLRAVGWQAQIDNFETRSGSNAASRRCDDVMRDAGQPTGLYGFCESLFFLQAAFERATVVSPAGLREAVHKLGESYQSPSTIEGATRFGPGDSDGISMVRPYAYNPETNAFHFTGGPERLPD